MDPDENLKMQRQQLAILRQLEDEDDEETRASLAWSEAHEQAAASLCDLVEAMDELSKGGALPTAWQR